MLMKDVYERLEAGTAANKAVFLVPKVSLVIQASPSLILLCTFAYA